MSMKIHIEHPSKIDMVAWLREKPYRVGLCGMGTQSQFTRHVSKVTCKHCLKQLTRFRPWQQKAVACGQDIKPSVACGTFPVTRC